MEKDKAFHVEKSDVADALYEHLFKKFREMSVMNRNSVLTARKRKPRPDKDNFIHYRIVIRHKHGKKKEVYLSLASDATVELWYIKNRSKTTNYGTKGLTKTTWFTSESREDEVLNLHFEDPMLFVKIGTFIDEKLGTTIKADLVP